MIVVVIISYINKAFFYNEFAGGIRASLCVFTLIIIFTFLLRKLLQKIINTDISNSHEIIFYFILTVVCILISFYETFNDITINIEFFVNVLTMAILFFCLGSFIYQTIKNNILTKKNDKLMEFMTTYENELEDLRIEEHETKNELVIVRGRLCDNQERQDIIDYIDDTLKDRIEIKQEEFVKLGYLPPNGIKGFCYLKVHEAQKQGISTKINISSRVQNSNIYRLNLKEQKKLGKILGVYLDNAIEAAKESEKKIIGIEAYLNKNKECQLIISNSYKKIPNAEKIVSERISTKGTKRGHGLLLVKRIVNNSDVFETKTEINNVVYIQKVIIKK